MQEYIPHAHVHQGFRFRLFDGFLADGHGSAEYARVHVPAEFLGLILPQDYESLRRGCVHAGIEVEGEFGRAQDAAYRVPLHVHRGQPVILYARLGADYRGTLHDQLVIQEIIFRPLPDDDVHGQQ
jgi:hypothetical protein